VLDPVDDIGPPGDDAADRGKGLRERRHDEVDIVLDPEMLSGSPSARAHHAEAVGLVHHEARAVLLLQLDDGRKVREVPFHGVDAVHDDELPGGGLGIREKTLQVLHVVVAEALGLPVGRLHALDERGVDHPVRKDQVVAQYERRDGPEVGPEARREDDRSFLPEILGKTVVELVVEGHRPVQDA
jgi:hypothetical protein